MVSTVAALQGPKGTRKARESLAVRGGEPAEGQTGWWGEEVSPQRVRRAGGVGATLGLGERERQVS